MCYLPVLYTNKRFELLYNNKVFCTTLFVSKFLHGFHLEHSFYKILLTDVSLNKPVIYMIIPRGAQHLITTFISTVRKSVKFGLYLNFSNVKT